MFQSPSGVLGVCRFQHGVSDLGRLFSVSVPFRGFRGLQERIAKPDRVVWLPYPSRFPHSSCIVVHLFSPRHPGIAPFPPFPHPVLETRKTPPKWPRVSMNDSGTALPILPCYGAPPRILTARCPPLSLPCFGRVSKRPRESALFAVPAESTRVFTAPRFGASRHPGGACLPVGGVRAVTDWRTSWLSLVHQSDDAVQTDRTVHVGAKAGRRNAPVRLALDKWCAVKSCLWRAVMNSHLLISI